MRRADETLRLMTGRAPDLVLEGLREMDFGAFEMKSHEMLRDDPDYLRWIGDEAGEAACSEQEKAARIEILKEQMQQAARELEFEEAAKLRDEIKKLMGETVTASKAVRPGMVGSAKKSRGRSRK